jgi:large subunit ribosomal protein L23
MIKPVFTEKSLGLARQGKYTFWVSKNDTKTSLKSEIAKMFGVHVVTIKTISVKGESKRNVRGRKVTYMPKKKAIVTLKDKEKIDLFEETKK